MCLFFFKSKRHISWYTTFLQNKKDRIHKPSIPFASHPSSHCHQHNLPETPLCRVISLLEDLQSFPISYWVKSKFTCEAFKDSHNLVHCAYSIFVSCTSRAEGSLSVRPACELFHPECQFTQSFHLLGSFSCHVALTCGQFSECL